MEVIVPDSSRIYSGSGVIESKSVGTFSPSQKQDSHRGLLVDRGVGSPRLVKSASASTFTVDLRMDTETKVRKKMYLKNRKKKKLKMDLHRPSLSWTVYISFF